MKIFLPFFFLILLTLTSCDYNPGVSEAFTKYRFKEGVTTITIPGWAIRLATNFGDLKDSEREFLSGIDKVRVLVVENEELNSRINLHREFSERINKNNDFDELMTVRDKNEDVTIFGKMDNDVISEMVVLVGGDDNALVYLRGEINPKLLNDLVNKKETDNLLSFKF